MVTFGLLVQTGVFPSRKLLNKSQLIKVCIALRYLLNSTYTVFHYDKLKIIQKQETNASLQILKYISEEGIRQPAAVIIYKQVMVMKFAWRHGSLNLSYFVSSVSNKERSPLNILGFYAITYYVPQFGDQKLVLYKTSKYISCLKIVVNWSA